MKYIKYVENNTDKFRDAVIKNDIDKVIEGLKQVKRILSAKEMMPKDKR